MVFVPSTIHVVLQVGEGSQSDEEQYTLNIWPEQKSKKVLTNKQWHYAICREYLTKIQITKQHIG